jgi:hypothetical protein
MKEEQVVEHLLSTIWGTVRPLVLEMNRSIAKNKKSVAGQLGNAELKTVQGQKRKLTKQYDQVLNLILDMEETPRLTNKLKQIEAELKTVEEQINQLLEVSKTDPNMVWVDHFLQSSEDLIGFPLNWKGKTVGEQNAFLRKHFNSVSILDGQIKEVVFSENVQKLLQVKDKLLVVGL